MAPEAAAALSYPTVRLELLRALEGELGPLTAELAEALDGLGVALRYRLRRAAAAVAVLVAAEWDVVVNGASLLFYHPSATTIASARAEIARLGLDVEMFGYEDGTTSASIPFRQAD